MPIFFYIPKLLQQLRLMVPIISGLVLTAQEFTCCRPMISYKSTATGGGPANNDVYAYPNPVRPEYTGLIAIKGLVNNADFKITDINGNLIYSGVAEGGQAIWDGKNFDGRKAQTGVYLVFASNSDGSETIVTKILFVN